MGTVEGNKPMFDGTSKQWQSFKIAMRKWAGLNNVGFILEAGQSICTIFPAASASAAKSKTATKGSISLNLETYKEKDIEDEFKKTSVTTSVALAVRRNRKEQLGSNWADAERCGLSEHELIKAHEVLDAKYLREVNRTVARTLHDAVFPIGGAETNTTTRLRSILKSPLAAKIIAGESVGEEALWSKKPWLMESTLMWAKLV